MNKTKDSKREANTTPTV